MESALERLTMFTLAHRRIVLVGWLLLCVIGAFFAAGLPSRIVPGGEAPADSESEVVASAIAGSALPSVYLVVTSPAGTAPETQLAAARSVADSAMTVPGITAVTPLAENAAVTAAGDSVSVLGVSTTGGTDGAIAAAHALEEQRADFDTPGAQVYVGGFGAYRDQLTALSQQDLERAELVGIPIVFIVLFITFGSIWAAGLPLVIAISALLMGLGAVGICSYFLPMSDFVTNSASLIGIALGVDYAMFLVQRVRELTRAGTGLTDAMKAVMRKTGTAVVWSGLTVIAAESALLLVDSRSIRSAAFGMMMVTVFAVATAIVIAPILIVSLGKRVAGFGRHSLIPVGGRWELWAKRVTRAAPAWLIGGVVLLACLAVPTIQLNDSVSISGVETLPADASVRLAAEAATAAYGPGAVSPIIVLLPPNEASESELASRLILADDAVAGVSKAGLADGSVALLVTSRTSPYDPQSRELVQRLRAGDIDDLLIGIEHTVGGETADSLDATSGMFDGLSRIGIVLLVIIGSVLLLALRSVFLPIKAVILVVLSLGASLGCLLLLTTTEWGAALTGANGPGDIHPIVPVTIVAITVALGTDYEVMLLSRIKEYFQQSDDNRESIVNGVGRTGGVITSAAVIMIAVFLGFAMADLAPLKQLGVGLALAVLLDATVVRGVLVPASMAVMGRANWWWPGSTPRRAKRRRARNDQGPSGPAQNRSARSLHRKPGSGSRVRPATQSTPNEELIKTSPAGTR